MMVHQHYRSQINRCRKTPLRYRYAHLNTFSFGSVHELIKWLYFHVLRFNFQFKSLNELSIHIDTCQVDYAGLFTTISKIPNLNTLYLQNGADYYNKWVVPSEIGLCTQLKNLTLEKSGYSFLTIPTEIKNLLFLETLSVSGEVQKPKKIKKLLPENCYTYF